MKKIIFISMAMLNCLSMTVWANESTLKELLEQAYNNNSSLLEQKSKYEAENAMITSASFLDDPSIGISQLNRGNETKYGVVSQKIRFPVKYYLQGKAQSSRAKASHLKLATQRFDLRKQVIDAYFGIFALQKVIQLIEANMQAVREFSRVAERKYAAGTARQGDSMKAHFELTNLELELIRHKQEEEALQSKLRALLNNPNFSALTFPNGELQMPENNLQVLNLKRDQLESDLKQRSPRLQSEIFKLQEYATKSTLSKWEYAPDFQVQYQKRISGLPEESDILMVQATLPFWFWKKNAEASAATFKKIAQQHKVRSETNHLLERITNLRGKVEVGEKTLKIYKTSLIPQAQGAYNSSKAAYRANKTSFLDLLDSERSLFKVKTGYYRSLQMYVRHLVGLEAELGFEISNIENIKVLIDRGTK